MKHATLIAVLLAGLGSLFAGCSSCQSEAEPEADTLNADVLSGKWEAVQVDGQTPPDGQKHYFEFKDGKCIFSRVRKGQDPDSPQVRAQSEPCRLVSDENGNRLVVESEGSPALEVNFDDGTLSLSLTMPNGQARVTRMVRSEEPDPAEADGQRINQRAINEKTPAPDGASD